MIWSKWVWTAKFSPLLLQVHHLFSTMTSDQVCIKVLIHHHLAFIERLKLRWLASHSQLATHTCQLFAQLCVTRSVIFCSWGQAQGVTLRYCRWSGSPPVSLPTILSSLAPMTSSAGQVLQSKYIYKHGLLTNRHCMECMYVSTLYPGVSKTVPKSQI